MNDRTRDIIKKFHPQPIRIPIDKCELEEVAETLVELLFPICHSPRTHNIIEEFNKAGEKLHLNIKRLTDRETADKKTELFFERLILLQGILLDDAECYLRFDPAAKSLEEVILAYPGFYALCMHRIAHELHQLDLPLFARIFSEYAHSKVGIDIHPAAKVGKNLFMDHGTGIVIGETAVIGNNVKIYQGVTLGALYVEKKLSDVKRHPTVEDNVVIYANATILGGNTVIGHDSTIGGGSWLTRSVIPYSVVTNSVNVKIRPGNDFSGPYDFVI